jgi:D-serine deaminase-like pyridoxal phosphate-dependent protein
MYFTVTVKMLSDNGNGKIKKVTERYLVDAMSVTEAEARATEYLAKGGTHDFEIVAAGVSRVVGVIEKSV